MNLRLFYGGDSPAPLFAGVPPPHPLCVVAAQAIYAPSSLVGRTVALCLAAPLPKDKCSAAQIKAEIIGFAVLNRAHSYGKLNVCARFTAKIRVFRKIQLRDK